MDQPYPGAYRAKALLLRDGALTALVPQVFGDINIVITEFTGDLPATSEMGWVVFQSGDPEHPVWVSKSGSSNAITDHGGLTGLGDDDHPQYLTDAEGGVLFSPVVHNHDAAYVNVTGDTMTGALKVVAPPVAPTDAAAKSYVDSRVLDNLVDVDTTTVAPIEGDSLAFHTATGLWAPRALQTPAYFFVRCQGGSIPTTEVAAILATPGLASGFSMPVNTQVQCDVAGKYHVAITASQTGTVVAGGWVQIGIAHIRGGSVLSATYVVSGTAGSWGSTAAVAELDMTTGDLIEYRIFAGGGATARTLDNRSQLTIVPLLGAKGDQGAPGSGIPVVANVAALPTGVAAGYSAATADTGTVWTWTGSLWRPMSYPQQGSLAFTGGTIPTSGNLALGTISIAAVAWPRWVTVGAMALIGSSTTASAHQITYTHLDGQVFFGRVLGSAATMTAVIPSMTRLLAANTAGSFVFTANFGGGTSATATVTADARFSRAEWSAIPA